MKVQYALLVVGAIILLRAIMLLVGAEIGYVFLIDDIVRLLFELIGAFFRGLIGLTDVL